MYGGNAEYRPLGCVFLKNSADEFLKRKGSHYIAHINSSKQYGKKLDSVRVLLNYCTSIESVVNKKLQQFATFFNPFGLTVTTLYYRN
jgi:hypothetical protein